MKKKKKYLFNTRQLKLIMIVINNITSFINVIRKIHGYE